MGGTNGSGWVVSALLVWGCGGQPAPAAPEAGSAPASPQLVAVPAEQLASKSAADTSDESDPRYWVAELGQPESRTRALRRLEQFYEDAITRNDGDMKAPEVGALIDLTVQPLVQTYVQHYAELETRTRVGLLKLLAEYEDPRIEPALKKAFDEFIEHPATSKEDADLKWAARALSKLKLPALAMPLLEASGALKASTTLGGVSYKNVSEALLAMPDKAWVVPLIARLEPEVKAPRDARDAPLLDAFRDQLFWQVSAAQLLGRLGDARAVAPLLRVMLDPAKADIQVTALLALVRLGKPSVDAASKLLQGTDTELIAFSKERVEALTGRKMLGSPYTGTAALVLGTIGRSDGEAPLLAALQAEKDLPLRALYARELSKLPASAASKAAFQRAYATIKVDTELPGEAGAALEVLTEAAGSFRDSSWVDWLLQRAAQASGNSEDVASYRATVVMTALKLARPAQLPAVKKAVDRYGSVLEKAAYQQTLVLLNECSERVDCYMSAIQKPEYREPSRQWSAIKAGYMLGILGGDATRDQLVAAIDGLTNPAARFVAAQTIDHLSPHRNESVVAKLDAIITKNANSADRDKAAYDAPLRQVMYRIGARD